MVNEKEGERSRKPFVPSSTSLLPIVNGSTRPHHPPILLIRVLSPQTVNRNLPVANGSKKGGNAAANPSFPPQIRCCQSVMWEERHSTLLLYCCTGSGSLKIIRPVCSVATYTYPSFKATSFTPNRSTLLGQGMSSEINSDW